MNKQVLHVYHDEASVYWCALCLISLGNERTLVDIHVNTGKHKKGLMKKNWHWIGRAFHATWRDQNDTMRSQKVYFYPTRPNQMICLLCQNFVTYSHLDEHIQSDCHVERLEVVEKVGTYCWLDVKPSPPSKDKPQSSQNNVPKGDEKPTTEKPAKDKQSKDNVDSETPKKIVLKKNENVRNIYECSPCKFITTKKKVWQTHTFSDTHFKICKPLDNFAEHTCSQCSPGVIFDALNMPNHEHFSMYRQQFLNAHESSFFPGIKIFSSPETLSSFIKQLSVTNEFHHQPKIVDECCIQLQMTLASIFPRCRVYPFGSRLTNLCVSYSDLDVFVDIGNNYDGTAGYDPSLCVLASTRTIRKKGFPWSYCYGIPKARTPIVTVEYVPNSLHCDISFTNGLGVENTKLTRYYVKLQSVLKPMILFLKKWAELCQFTGMKSYSLTLMAIFYLQQEKYLPSLNELRQRGNPKEMIISNWDCSFPEEVYHIPQCPLPIATLMENLFNYYANFGFENNVISILMGHSLKKADFKNVENLPPEMHRYVKYIENDDVIPFITTTQMCVQDPFDLSHNTTKNIKLKLLIKFRRACALSATMLRFIKRKYQVVLN